MDPLFKSLARSQLLTVVLWSEARGEPIEGQIAVGCSIRNRVDARRFGFDWPGVLLKPYQYSGLIADGSVNYEATWDLAGKLIRGEPLSVLERQLRWVAEGLMARDLLDNTQNATHYHTIDIRPRWSESPARLTVVIGRHKFYADVQ